MRVLGIDPGTFRTGVGVVDSEYGDLSWVYAGVLSPSKKDTLSERLYFIYKGLVALMCEWTPREIAVEEPFVARNIKAAMAIGRAHGVAMVAAARCGLKIHNYSPREVKQSVTDYGGSSKSQVQDMVRVTLGINSDQSCSPDAADALAVAICHINARQISRLIIRE